MTSRYCKILNVNNISIHSIYINNSNNFNEFHCHIEHNMAKILKHNVFCSLTSWCQTYCANEWKHPNYYGRVMDTGIRTKPDVILCKTGLFHLKRHCAVYGKRMADYVFQLHYYQIVIKILSNLFKAIHSLSLMLRVKNII